MVAAGCEGQLSSAPERYRKAAPESGTGKRYRKAVPKSGAEERCRKAVPISGAEKRGRNAVGSIKAVPKSGAGIMLEISKRCRKAVEFRDEMWGERFPVL